MNECAEGIHSCFEGTEECRNIEGAYECDVKCDKGFTYNVNLGTCVGNYFMFYWCDYLVECTSLFWYATWEWTITLISITLIITFSSDIFSCFYRYVHVCI